MKRFLFTVLTVIILLVLLEGLSRVVLSKIYNRKFDSSLIVKHKYRNTPGLKENATGYVWGQPFHTDEFGCRKSPVPYSSKKKKWLYIGDSVTEGVGVDDSSTFAAIVAKQVDSVNIMNYSLIGYSDFDYYELLKSVLAKDDSSIARVTIFFCLNDVYGKSNSAELPEMARPNLIGKINSRLQDDYATYKLIKLFFYQNSNRYFQYDAGFYSSDYFRYVRSMDYLRLCNEACKSAGVKMDVVMLPYRSQLNNPDASARNPQNMVKAFCSSLQIPFADPIDFCSKDNNPKKLYLFADEIHFSEEGHKTMAHYILSH